MDLGWQAPGQWLVTFLISTKGGKLASPWGMPASPGRESFTGNDLGFMLHFLQPCIPYQNCLSCAFFFLLGLLFDIHGESYLRLEGMRPSPGLPTVLPALLLPLPMPFHSLLSCIGLLTSVLFSHWIMMAPGADPVALVHLCGSELGT